MPAVLLIFDHGEVRREDRSSAHASFPRGCEPAYLARKLGVRAEEVGEQMSGVRWIRSYYSAAEGKLYCEYEAPSLELLLEFERRAGMPVDHATVVQNLEPSMFR